MEIVKENIMPRGGSDIMLEGLGKNIDLDKYNINIIQSRCMSQYVEDDKINVLWQHINVQQPYVQGIKDKFFRRMIDAFVYVSHWQQEKYRFVHQIPLENAYVIKNAIDPIEYIPRSKSDKIKIIFNAAPDRGLNVMLDAFALLNRDDIELDVYSSNEIYGSDFVEYVGTQYDNMFEAAKNMKNVNFFGYAPNKEIRSALQSSNIWAYPCIVEETSCLSMIEAAAAGCRMIVTNVGALPETGSEFAAYSIIQPEYEDLVKRFAKDLNDTIDSYWSDSVQNNLKIQSDFYNSNYSWQNRIVEWKKLFESLQPTD